MRNGAFPDSSVEASVVVLEASSCATFCNKLC